MATVVIEIRDGEIQSIFSDDDETSVIVYNFDEFEDKDINLEDMRHEFEEVVENMAPIY